MVDRKNKLNIDLILNSDKFKAGIQKSRQELNGMQQTMQSLKTAAAGFVGAFSVGVVVNELKNAYLAAEESAKVFRQVEQTVRATGGAAGLTADEIAAMASSYEELTAIDGEVILGAQNILLTFKNISEDIFPETTQAVLDMATTMGTDFNSAAVQLGKALNDPIKGITALTRVGVSFTEEQKNLIKTLVESGRRMEAQKIILEELKSEFGGAAEAAKTGTAELGIAFEGFQESIGKFFTGGVGGQFSGWLAKTIKDFTTLADSIRVATSKLSQLKESELIQRRQVLLDAQKRGEFVDLGPGAEIKAANEITEINRQIIALRNKNKELQKNAVQPEFNTGSAGKTKSTPDSIKRMLEERKAGLQALNEGKNLLAGLGLDKDDPYYQTILDNYVSMQEELTKIDLSKEANKGQLRLDTRKYWEQKTAEEILKIDEALRKKQEEDETKGQQIISEAKRGAFENNFKVTADANKKYADMTADAWQRGFNRIMDHSLTFKERMIAAAHEILFHFAKMQDIEALTPFKGSSGFLGTAAKVGLNLLGSFDTGGIIPGSYMQPGLAVVHGQEEVLRPDDPRHIKNMNNQGSQPIIVHNSYNIKAFDSQDVKQYLYQNAQDIASITAKAIRENTSGLRTQVRGA